MTEKNNSSSVRIFIFSKTVAISINLQFHSGKLFCNKIKLYALYTENIFKQNSVKLLQTYRI